MLLFKFIGKLQEINQISCVLAFLDTVASYFESKIRLYLLKALFRHKSSEQIEITIHF